MTDRVPGNNGYQPSKERGYNPSSNKPVPLDMPNNGQPGAGYQPVNSGSNPGNPPKKP